MCKDAASARDVSATADSALVAAFAAAATASAATAPIPLLITIAVTASAEATVIVGMATDSADVGSAVAAGKVVYSSSLS